MESASALQRSKRQCQATPPHPTTLFFFFVCPPLGRCEKQKKRSRGGGVTYPTLSLSSFPFCTGGGGREGRGRFLLVFTRQRRRAACPPNFVYPSSSTPPPPPPLLTFQGPYRCLLTKWRGRTEVLRESGEGETGRRRQREGEVGRWDGPRAPPPPVAQAAS